MIKNIVFDLGNIVIKTDYNKIIPHFTSDPDEVKFIYDEIINSPELIKYGLVNTGFLTIEEIIDIINDRTNNEHKELVRDFLLNYPKYKEYNSNILEIIEKLKNKGYKVYLLSNLSDYIYDLFKDKLESLFDGLVLSYEIHMIKPYDGIYKYLLNTYSLIPEETLFLDDKEENIKTANKFGIKGRRVLPGNIDDIKEVLKEYRVI